jgi:hypothetical protein
MTENQLSLAFPLPPSYFKNYTQENLQRLEEKDADAPNLEPPEPIEGPFTVFGQLDNVCITHIGCGEVPIS